MIEGSPSGKGEPNRKNITGPVDKRLGPVPNVRVCSSLVFVGVGVWLCLYISIVFVC